MVSTSARPVSRPLNFWLCLGIPTVAAIILVLLELTDLDMDLARLFYDPVAGDFYRATQFFSLKTSSMIVPNRWSLRSRCWPSSALSARFFSPG